MAMGGIVGLQEGGQLSFDTEMDKMPSPRGGRHALDPEYIRPGRSFHTGRGGLEGSYGSRGQNRSRSPNLWKPGGQVTKLGRALKGIAYC